MTNLIKSTTPADEKDRWSTTWFAFADAQRLFGQFFQIDVCAEPPTAKVNRYIISDEQYQALSVDGLLTDDNGDLFYQNKQIYGVNALAVDWLDCWWCNPPFSQKETFIEKAIEQDRRGNHGMMMLPYQPLTKWWTELVDPNAARIFEPDGRYDFMLPDGETVKRGVSFGCVFVLFDCTQREVPRTRFKRGISMIEMPWF